MKSWKNDETVSLFFFDGEKTLFEEMDDLTTFELEQIARLEAKCVEARHKSSQEWSILEQNFHKLLLIIQGWLLLFLLYM